MSVIATALRHLMAAGVSGDDLLRAVEEMEAEMVLTAPVKPRSAGAIRTARYRERKASHVTSQASHPSQNASQSVTCDGCDVTQGETPSLPLAPSPNENISNPHPHTPTRPDNISAREKSEFHVVAWTEFQAAKAAGKPKRGNAFTAIPRPPDVSEQVWSDFLTMRAKLRADVSETAIKGFRREADRVGWTLERAISESIERQWRGFKADWVKNHDRNRNGSPPAGHRTAGPRTDGFTAALNDDIDRARSGRASGASGRWDGEASQGDFDLSPARTVALR